MDTFAMLGLAASVLQLLELGRSVSNTCSGDPSFDKDSVETSLDEITAHLRSLSLAAKGTDLERVVLQCLQHRQEIAAILRFQIDSSKSAEREDRDRLARQGVILRHKQLPLRQQVPALLLRSIRYVIPT